MTVIAWDGKTLAADRFAVAGGHCTLITKIIRHNGHLLGGAGETVRLMAMHDWFIAGADPKTLPACQRDPEKFVDYLIVRPDRTAWRMENTAHMFPIEEDFYAVGGAAPYAFGAMAAGANAIRAVEIASQFAEGVGGGVDFLRHDQ